MQIVEDLCAYIQMTTGELQDLRTEIDENFVLDGSHPRLEELFAAIENYLTDDNGE